MMRLSIEMLLSCVLLSLNHHYYYSFLLLCVGCFFLPLPLVAVCVHVQRACGMCDSISKCIESFEPSLTEINWRFWNEKRKGKIMIKSENGQTAQFPMQSIDHNDAVLFLLLKHKNHAALRNKRQKEREKEKEMKIKGEGECGNNCNKRRLRAEFELKLNMIKAKRRAIGTRFGCSRLCLHC